MDDKKLFEKKLVPVYKKPYEAERPKEWKFKKTYSPLKKKGQQDEPKTDAVL